MTQTTINPPPLPRERVLNVRKSHEPERDFLAAVAHPAMLTAPAILPEFNAWTQKQPIRNQSVYGACVGYGVTDAINYQLGLTDERWYHEPLSAMYVWMRSKVLDKWAQTDPMSGGDGTEIKTALDVVRNEGNLYERYAPLGSITTYQYQRMRADASWIKIQSYWSLRANSPAATASSICRWIASNKQAIIGINVHQPFMDIGNRVLTVRDAMGPSLGGHCCRLVGYANYKPDAPLNTMFRVANSWNTDWGIEGYGWVDAAWLGAAMFEAYGLEIGGVQYHG